LKFNLAMAIHHADPGEVVDIRPFGNQLSSSRTTALVKTDSMEVIRVVLPTHESMPPHRVEGEITVQCLEGRVQFSTGDSRCELTAGHFLYLRGGVLHCLLAIEDSSLLVTILLTPKKAKDRCSLTAE
jgi:quercetin dioxygenase-like cupin family protein